MSSDVQAKVQETVRAELRRVRDLSTEAAKSKAWLYPLKGIAYYILHRDLWKPFLTRLAPCITLSVGVITGMFTFAYLPQAAILSLVNGPLAVFTTVLLVLSESATIITLLSKNFMIADALIDTFDAVLLTNELTHTVGEGRVLVPGSNPMSRLGKMPKSPLSKYTPEAFIRYVMYLPLNFIPVVGTVIFISLQGRRVGPTSQQRYFQLKGMSRAQKEEWIERNRGAYTSFGTVAVLLEMVPLASILFAFTNTVGAALWAVDIEKGKFHELPPETGPKSRDSLHKKAQ